MTARVAWGWIAASSAVLACGGCGFKGPLYLPEPNATVVTHPPQSAAPAGQAQSPEDKTNKNDRNPGKSSPPAPSPPGSAPQSPPPQ